MYRNCMGDAGYSALVHAFETKPELDLAWSSNDMEIPSPAVWRVGDRVWERRRTQLGVVALLSAAGVGSATGAARRFAERDGDHAVAVRVLGFLLR